ncbi:MAG: hypothetical protein M9938_02865 [Solirubrobacterales bacterium]|nr:hypothetical protein [Solirubrobacterales bacterium]
MSGTAGSGEHPGEIPADEVIAALEDYQRRTIELYALHRGDPEGCVMALVRLHLAWTEEDPARARMVAVHRNAVMAGPDRERLSRSNSAYFKQTREWLELERASGLMPVVSFNVLHALVFAPSQELAKHWLGGRLRKLPTEYADRMGRAAWAGILAAGDQAGGLQERGVR